MVTHTSPLPPVIDWPELGYYYQVLQNLHFLLNLTRLQDWSHTMRPWCFFKPCLNCANFLCLFHCSLTVTTIVKLCVTILTRLGAPVVTSHLPGCCPATEPWPGLVTVTASWQMSPALPSPGSLTNDHAPRSKISANPQPAARHD